MARKSQSGGAEKLRQLRERIDRWRSRRVKLWPMPSELWREATTLARELGVCRVHRALKVNYGSLKQRVEEVRPRGEVGPVGGEFVELTGARLLGMATGPVVELSDGNGVHLTVRLAAGSALDVAQLVEAFRGRMA